MARAMGRAGPPGAGDEDGRLHVRGLPEGGRTDATPGAEEVPDTGVAQRGHVIYGMKVAAMGVPEHRVLVPPQVFINFDEAAESMNEIPLNVVNEIRARS